MMCVLSHFTTKYIVGPPIVSTSNMAIPTTTEESETSGSFTCGKVSYEAVIDTPKIGIVYCHCTNCQEAHTAPYIGAFLLPEANVTWTGRYLDGNGHHAELRSTRHQPS